DHRQFARQPCGAGLRLCRHVPGAEPDGKRSRAIDLAEPDHVPVAVLLATLPRHAAIVSRRHDAAASATCGQPPVWPPVWSPVRLAPVDTAGFLRFLLVRLHMIGYRARMRKLANRQGPVRLLFVQTQAEMAG